MKCFLYSILASVLLLLGAFGIIQAYQGINFNVIFVHIILHPWITFFVIITLALNAICHVVKIINQGQRGSTSYFLHAGSIFILAIVFIFMGASVSNFTPNVNHIKSHWDKKIFNQATLANIYTDAYNSNMFSFTLSSYGPTEYSFVKNSIKYKKMKDHKVFLKIDVKNINYASCLKIKSDIKNTKYFHFVSLNDKNKFNTRCGLLNNIKMESIPFEINSNY